MSAVRTLRSIRRAAKSSLPASEVPNFAQYVAAAKQRRANATGNLTHDGLPARQNADGSQYNGPPVGPNNRPRPTVQTGNAPVPGAFNGANPATVVGSANTTQGGNGPRPRPIWSGGPLDGGV